MKSSLQLKMSDKMCLAEGIFGSKSDNTIQTAAAHAIVLLPYADIERNSWSTEVTILCGPQLFT